MHHLYQIAHLPKEKNRWPQYLLFFKDAELEPRYKFVRKNLGSKWTGHGISAATRAEVILWVDRKEGLL